MYLEFNEKRHPAVQDIAAFFEFEHLDEPMRSASESIADVAQEMLDGIPDDSAEFTTGMRKLLEAKDCFVRAALISAALD